MQLPYRMVVTMVAAVTAINVLSACTGTTPSPSEGPADVSGQVYPTMAGSTAVELGRPPAVLPAELVGTWSGDDNGGVGSWTLVFSGDGRYQMTNERRGVRINGTAAVDGSRLTMQPSTGRATTVTWSVSGGRLLLDGSVYLRTDRTGNDAQALVGTWLSVSETYKTLRFAGNGTFVLDNPAADSVSGTYTVSGTQLTLRAAGRTDTSFAWSVRSGFLTLRLPDGTMSEYTRTG